MMIACAAIAWTPPPLRSHVRSHLAHDRAAILRMTASAGGEPSIEILAARQRMAMLLNSNWAAASEVIGWSGAAAVAAPSTVHGMGLFADRDVDAGELLTLYPVHRVLQTLGDGRGAGALGDEEDEKYFQPTEPVDPDELVYRQVAYRQTFSHPDPSRPETFQLDANPNKPDVVGWLGHRINDYATLKPSESSNEAAVLQYYEASGSRRNCCAVALCVPFLGFVSTRPVQKGEEIFATYGHTYWLQKPDEEEAGGGGAVDAAVMEAAKEVVRYQQVVDTQYAKQVTQLHDFVSQVTPEQVDQVAAGLRGGSEDDGTGSKPAAGNRAARRAAKAKKGKKKGGKGFGA